PTRWWPSCAATRPRSSTATTTTSHKKSRRCVRPRRRLGEQMPETLGQGGARLRGFQVILELLAGDADCPLPLRGEAVCAQLATFNEGVDLGDGQFQQARDFGHGIERHCPPQLALRPRPLEDMTEEGGATCSTSIPSPRAGLFSKWSRTATRRFPSGCTTTKP